MFVTVHILQSLPLHNLNRDQSGQPKSLFDGGVQRGRLSSQALKRAARVAYATNHAKSAVRTRQATTVVMDEATRYAEANGFPFDEKAARTQIKKVLDALVKKTKEAKDDTDEADDATEGGDNILFFAVGELNTLAHAVVNAQQDGSEVKREDFIQDASSPSLEVAAFGRMFAMDTAAGTHAAIAVSHATTTHQMALTPDYFTAVEEVAQDHAGAAHIGMSYYTSGVYYRSFTIDTTQLARSWSGVKSDSAREDLTELVKALVRALPSGRSTNSNPYTIPALVLVETQKCRTAYGFETPVTTTDGGYLKPSVKALADQRALALKFDPANTPSAVVWGDTLGEDFAAAPVEDVNAIAGFIVDEVYKSL